MNVDSRDVALRKIRQLVLDALALLGDDDPTVVGMLRDITAYIDWRLGR